MNEISRTKIEYGDFAFNPVIGCLRGCPYCWARVYARRFAKIWAKREVDFLLKNESLIPKDFDAMRLIRDLKVFKITFLEHQFAKEFPSKPSTILVGFMSDIVYWKPEWMKRILDKIRQYPQHKFVFLSKEPNAYENIVFPSNCILGYTTTNSSNLRPIFHYAQSHNNNKILLNIEPIHKRFDETTFQIFDWIIVGAETGNRKGKIIPEKRWIETIVNQAKTYNIPIFMKDNLKEIWGEKLIQERT